MNPYYSSKLELSIITKLNSKYYNKKKELSWVNGDYESDTYYDYYIDPPDYEVDLGYLDDDFTDIQY